LITKWGGKNRPLLISHICPVFGHFLAGNNFSRQCRGWSLLDTNCFQQRVKNVCSGRSSDMLTKLRPARFFWHKCFKSNIKIFSYINSNYTSPSYEHLKKVCEPYIFLKETDAEFKRRSNFGLLRHLIANCAVDAHRSDCAFSFTSYKDRKCTMKKFGINCQLRNKLFFIVIFHFSLVNAALNAPHLCKLWKAVLGIRDILVRIRTEE
jgi:hypothetical protein